MTKATIVDEEVGLVTPTKLFKEILTNVLMSCICFQVSLSRLGVHPSPDNPQKKNQNHHLEDPKIYQVDDVGYLKKQVAKSLQGTFFNKINLKTL